MSQAHTERPAKVIDFNRRGKFNAGRRARGQVEPVVFWIREDGHLMLAPHTLMVPFPGYQKVECSSVREIEKWSRRMAQQEENNLRGLKVEEMMRSLPRWEQIITNCKLRLAHGCISNADEAVTKHTLASMERKKAKLIEIMMGNTSVAESSLAIENKEAPIGMAEYQQKKVVLQ